MLILFRKGNGLSNWWLKSMGRWSVGSETQHSNDNAQDVIQGTVYKASVSAATLNWCSTQPSSRQEIGQLCAVSLTQALHSEIASPLSIATRKVNFCAIQLLQLVIKHKRSLPF